MSFADLAKAIDAAWEARDTVTPDTTGPIRDAVDTALGMLDTGHLRVAEKVEGAWVTHQWLKKAVLLSFRLNPMAPIAGGPDGAPWYDKVPSKFLGWDDHTFKSHGFRAVPGAIVRRSAFIAPNVVLMPSFVNVGAHVGSGTMPGKALPDGSPGPGLYCAVIVKRVDERTRSKVSINELLRD